MNVICLIDSVYLEGMQVYAYDSPVIRKILSDEYQNIAFRETDEASVENRSVEPFVEEIIHALHVFDSTVAPEVAEYIRSKLQSPSTLSAREDLGTSEWDSDLDLSDLTIGIAGGHHKTRANIVERLLKLGVASCIEVAPSSESYLSKSKVAEAIRDCDLVGFITGYTGHDLSYILVSLNRTGAFRGRLMRLSCRGVSGVVRELTAKLQQMF
ncbi:hypothetical protein [Gloeobacter kilaueensis]|uniref:hypothetical protein n=1 Tax=Gloeobacter kilaueensis TaxID=1416614 RepID=UPI00165164D8|nr:hypothetical protein [Gloeobacter kilaueensis]